MRIRKLLLEAFICFLLWDSSCFSTTLWRRDIVSYSVAQLAHLDRMVCSWAQAINLIQSVTSIHGGNVISPPEVLASYPDECRTKRYYVWRHYEINGYIGLAWDQIMLPLFCAIFLVLCGRCYFTQFDWVDGWSYMAIRLSCRQPSLFPSTWTSDGSLDCDFHRPIRMHNIAIRSDLLHCKRNCI